MPEIISDTGDSSSTGNTGGTVDLSIAERI